MPTPEDLLQAQHLDGLAHRAEAEAAMTHDAVESARLLARALNLRERIAKLRGSAGA